MPHFPQPFTSSVSHWQATNRGPTSLYGHANPSSLPATADIVIIGGGTMGACLSYYLTREGCKAGEGKRIVLLEAKDVASGASGRNGGHIGPATHEALHHATLPIPYGSGLSEEEGMKLVQQERDNLDLVEEIIEREGWGEEVDFWRGELCEVHEGEQYTLKEKTSHLRWLSLRKKFGYEGDGDTRWYEGEEAKKISRMHRATSCLIRPAGSVHSAKLCTAFMSSALSSPHADFQLFTWTPVASITPASPPTSSLLSKGRWEVKTHKGEKIVAKRVILCTNAHTRDLIPSSEALHDHIFPVWGQAGYITPTTAYAGKNRLERTYNMEPGGWYAVQKSDGGIILGGGEAEMIDEGVIKPDERIGMVDDSKVIPAWTRLIGDYFPTHFTAWGKQALGEGLARTWSGVLGYSKDVLPLVGEVPEKEGLWVAVGFHGHGQSRIFSVARSLSYTLSSPTSEWDESLLPLPFKITAERLERSRKERQTISKPGVHNLEEASEGGMLEPVVEREEEDLERRAVDRLGEKMGGLGLSEKGEMKEPSVNKKSGFSCLIM